MLLIYWTALSHYGLYGSIRVSSPDFLSSASTPPTFAVGHLLCIFPKIPRACSRFLVLSPWFDSPRDFICILIIFLEKKIPVFTQAFFLFRSLRESNPSLEIENLSSSTDRRRDQIGLFFLENFLGQKKRFPKEDSNPHNQNQNLKCYHYTIGECNV